MYHLPVYMTAVHFKLTPVCGLLQHMMHGLEEMYEGHLN